MKAWPNAGRKGGEGSPFRPMVTKAQGAGMGVQIRRLREDDLEQADLIFRMAFGTALGLPDPTAFGGDAAWARPRWLAAPDAALGAEVDGRLVGSSFVTRWGSIGFVGPLTIHPDWWNRGVAQQLLARTMPLLDGLTHAGLYADTLKPKNVALYLKFGFWPGHLTMILAKPVGAEAPGSGAPVYSNATGGDRATFLEACRQVAAAVCPGLDLTPEIAVVDRLGLGETVLIQDDGRPTGLAVCHLGAGSEAGSGQAYVKFGAVTPGRGAAPRFERLLVAVEALAAARGASRLTAGLNLGRREAYGLMRRHGFTPEIMGVAMHRPAAAPWHGPDNYVIDDWR